MYLLDPDFETADTDKSNNSWPKKQEKSDFDKFKSKELKDRILKFNGQLLQSIIFLYLH